MHVLGMLKPSDTIFSVKQSLSKISDMEVGSMSLFLIADKRNQENELELRNHELVG